MFGEFTLNRLVDSILSEEGKKSGEFGLTKKANNALDEILKFVAGEYVKEPEEREYLRFKIYDSILLFKDVRRKLSRKNWPRSHYVTHVLWVARTFRKMGFDRFLTADVVGHDDIEHIETESHEEVKGDDYFEELEKRAKRYFEERNRSIFASKPLDTGKLPDTFRHLTWYLTRDQELGWRQEISAMKDIRTRRIREIALIAKGIDLLHNLLTTEFRPMNRDFWDYNINLINTHVKRSYEGRGDTYGIEQKRQRYITSRVYDARDLLDFFGLFARRMAARIPYWIAERFYSARIEQESELRRDGRYQGLSSLDLTRLPLLNKLMLYMDMFGVGKQEEHKDEGKIPAIVDKHKRSTLYKIPFDIERFITLELSHKISVRAKVIEYLRLVNNYFVGVNEEGKEGPSPRWTPEMDKLKELHDMMANEARRMFEDALHDIEKYWVSHWYMEWLWNERDRRYPEGEFHRLTPPDPENPFGNLYEGVIMPAIDGTVPITQERQDLNANLLVSLITLTNLVQGRDPITKRELRDPDGLTIRYHLVLK